MEKQEKRDKKILEGVTNWWVDIDGTIKCGVDVVPGASDAVNRMRESGDVTFVTNVTTSSSKGLAEELKSYGIECKPEEVYSATDSVIRWLHKNRPGARVLAEGTEAFLRQLHDHGIKLVDEKPDLALLGFNRVGNKLIFGDAYAAIHDGIDFVVTHDNINVPISKDKFMADTGILLPGIKKATGKDPLAIAGKPYSHMYEGLQDHLNLSGKEKIAMVGDGSSDMQFAHDYGLASVFVKTGGQTEEDMVKKGIAPHVVLDSIADYDKGDLER